MKLKLYLVILFSPLISTGPLLAQLSGVYTIGGSSPTYPNFTTAVYALIVNGVSGSVTFNVRNGTYYEQISIPPITGASAVNRITFQSETGIPAGVTLTSINNCSNYQCTTNYVVELNGASYISLKNMTIASAQTGNDYGTVITILYQASYDSIAGNVINGVIPGEFSQHATTILASPDSGTNVVICNNTISNGTGTVLAGFTNGPNCSNSVISNNTISNAYFAGISLSDLQQCLIEGNVITSNIPYPGYNVNNIGINMQQILSPICVVKNKIYMTGEVLCGMYVVNSHPGSLANGSLIANNFVSMTGIPTGANAIGILPVNNDYFRFYYNSVYTNNGRSCFDLYGASIGNVLANNIFYQDSTGGIQAPAITTGPGLVSSSDYNDIYTNSDVLGSWNGVNCSNLAAWKAASGFDMHSKSLTPAFTSATDLHLTSFTGMQFAQPLSSVTDDIDYNIRGTTPTIGADDVSTVNSSVVTCCSCLQLAFIASASNVCAGTAIQFTDKSSNSPISWNWIFAGGTPSYSDSEDPVIIYEMPGVYDVTLAVSSGSGTDTLIETNYITVDSLPIPGVLSAIPDSVCPGASSLLSVSGNTGIIQWQFSASGSNYANINGEDSSVYQSGMLLQTTEYRLVVTNANCADTSAPITVVVNPSPAPPVLSTNDSLICASDSTVIYSSAMYSSHLWNNGDTTNYTWVNDAGVYWVTVTDANGCSAVSGHLDISVYPVPSVSIIVQGDTLSSYGASFYQWYLNGDSIPGSNSPVFIASKAGNYSVGITDTNGCKALSNSTYVTITGISQFTGGGSLVAYPDPFANTIFINENETGAVVRNIKIYDILGRMVFNNKYNGIAPLTVHLELSELAQGPYYIKVETNQSERWLPIIKN